MKGFDAHFTAVGCCICLRTSFRKPNSRTHGCYCVPLPAISPIWAEASLVVVTISYKEVSCTTFGLTSLATEIALWQNRSVSALVKHGKQPQFLYRVKQIDSPLTLPYIRQAWR